MSAPQEATVTATYVIVGSPDAGGRHRADDLLDVFTTEVEAREAFRRRRLQLGPASRGATLVSFDRGVVRPLCWFGPEARPAEDHPRTREHLALRWVIGLAVLAMGAALWVLVDDPDRAVAAVAPQLSRTALITVTEEQRVLVTALNQSDGCHRVEIQIVDGLGRTVASEADNVCPAERLTVGNSPPQKAQLRSIVAVHSVRPWIVEPLSHTFEVLNDVDGTASVVVTKP